jgi:hypothetical protein
MTGDVAEAETTFPLPLRERDRVRGDAPPANVV